MPIKELVAKLDNTNKATPVEKINPAILETLRDMIETMEYHNMEYITGPDVGVDQQLLVLDGSQQNFNVLMMINPNVVYDVEGKIVVEYNDISGALQSIILVDKLADCIRYAREELGE